MARLSREWLRLKFRALLRRIGRHVPPGMRLVVGLLLMAGGLLAFLPVLGIWMLPLGIAVAALDVRTIQRWWRRQRLRRRRQRGRKGL
ncbi:hypothetical protein HMH01_07025 [Halovulum dunhuangense]|uniref:Uncharacterized protein n=1 Tax=Halovulum dunhuangense TaxID=1505036 RepID=A0A849L1R9_9RHOB|nr:hypothetical protein [Halovulum dunhuangense]NNU80189.1 hypothetical protein [Halovulum dunhuangense]